MTNKGMPLLPEGFQGKKKPTGLMNCLNTGNIDLNTSSKETLFQFSLMALFYTIVKIKL